MASRSRSEPIDKKTGTVACAIDLFCGAGGLTAGLEEAGWKTVSALDIDSDAIASLEATKSAKVEVRGRRGSYLQHAKLLNVDLREVSGSTLLPARVQADRRPDLLAGGPPCQPFSSAGRQGGITDPRGQLFADFVRIATELRPRYVLFENVPGLLTAKDPAGRPGGVLRRVQKAFEEIGFACRWALLNAADFGAPQRRVRLYMIASSDHSLPEFPKRTHGRPTDGTLLDALTPWKTLRDFLAGQPDPDPCDVVVPSGRRAADLLRLTPGTGLKTGGMVEANRPGGHWGYRQDSFLADPELPARTIRAASTPDWIRLPDGTLRRLTWRECAGLQGFPPEWRFVGTAASRFRQIGNAVQVEMARTLGSALLNALALGPSGVKTVSPPWPAEFQRRIRYTEMEHMVNGAHRAAYRRALAS